MIVRKKRQILEFLTKMRNTPIINWAGFNPHTYWLGKIQLFTQVGICPEYPQTNIQFDLLSQIFLLAQFTTMTRFVVYFSMYSLRLIINIVLAFCICPTLFVILIFQCTLISYCPIQLYLNLSPSHCCASHFYHFSFIPVPRAKTTNIMGWREQKLSLNFKNCQLIVNIS